MIRNSVLRLGTWIFTFALTTSLSGCESNEQVDERPNILVILCDDLGYSDVGFNGSTDIPTPALDNLANAGTVFTSGYVAHPFCGPSRAGLMTGRYPHEFGSQFNLLPNLGDINKTGIPVEEKFMSRMLQEAGYYTGIVGKWHLGTVSQFHPNNRGFDEFYGFLGGGHDYFPREYQPKYEAQVADGVEIINDYLKPLERNGEKVRETEYITDALSREAMNFISKAFERKDPFFLYLAYNAPHSPLQAKEEDLALFQDIEDKKRRTYAAMVYAVDRGVKEITETLKANGQLDNTLIVFFSDNGGKLTLGATNNPLREGKGSTCEGGYRVPMFFHWPAGLAESKKIDFPVSALDLYPTFASLAGVDIRSNKLDGFDILDNIRSNSNPREGKNLFVLRHREGWSDVGVRKDQWKALKHKQLSWQLFNIVEDPGENNDLSSEFPDILEQMVSDAETWSKTHAEPLWFNPASIREDWANHTMGEFRQTFVIDQ